MRRAKPQKPVPLQSDDELPLDDREDDDDVDDDEVAPAVVLGRFADLRGFADPALLAKYADRPIWFMVQDDADFITLFDRHPERPIAPPIARALLDVLRSFAAAESDALQGILGPTDAIEFGFHEGASIDDVAETFEDDGFDVAFVLRDGHVVDES